MTNESYPLSVFLSQIIPFRYPDDTKRQQGQNSSSVHPKQPESRVDEARRSRAGTAHFGICGLRIRKSFLLFSLILPSLIEEMCNEEGTDLSIYTNKKDYKLVSESDFSRAMKILGDAQVNKDFDFLTLPQVFFYSFSKGEEIFCTSSFS